MEITLKRTKISPQIVWECVLNHGVSSPAVEIATHFWIAYFVLWQICVYFPVSFLFSIALSIFCLRFLPAFHRSDFFSGPKHFYGRLFVCWSSLSHSQIFLYIHTWWGHRQTHIVTEMQAIIHTEWKNENCNSKCTTEYTIWKKKRNNQQQQHSQRVLAEQKKKLLQKIETNYHTLWLWF